MSPSRPFNHRRGRVRHAAFLLALLAIPALVSSGDELAWGQEGCRWVVVGYQHPFDVVATQVCNFWSCKEVQQQIPCQHPIMECR